MVALALASVPLAWWLDILSIQWLYVVGFAMGSGYVIGGGPEQVYLTFLVGREGLIAAQAQFAATESASRLLGPGIAGALVQMLGAPLAILCNVYRVDLEPAPHRRAGTATGAAADPSRAGDPRRAGLRLEPPAAAHAGLDLRLLAPAVLRLYRAACAVRHARARHVAAGDGGDPHGGWAGRAGQRDDGQAALSERYGGAGATIVIGLCGTALGFALLPAIPPALFGSTAATAAAYAVVMFWLDCGAMLFFMPYSALRQRG